MISLHMYLLVLFLGYPSDYNPTQEASVIIRAFYSLKACEETRLNMLKGANPGSANDHLECLYEPVMLGPN
jgi:hypothetical protein